ncbi:transposase [Actinomadura welshii]
MRRFDLTDGQWAVPKGPGRPSKWTKRQLIGGIRWRVRVGAPWRDVPECYGFGKRCMRCFAAGSGRACGRGWWPGCSAGRTQPG